MALATASRSSSSLCRLEERAMIPTTFATVVSYLYSALDTADPKKSA
jgi:hypothetical protein